MLSVEQSKIEALDLNHIKMCSSCYNLCKDTMLRPTRYSTHSKVAALHQYHVIDVADTLGLAWLSLLFIIHHLVLLFCFYFLITMLTDMITDICDSFFATWNLTFQVSSFKVALDYLLFGLKHGCSYCICTSCSRHHILFLLSSWKAELNCYATEFFHMLKVTLQWCYIKCRVEIETEVTVCFPFICKGRYFWPNNHLNVTRCMVYCRYGFINKQNNLSF